MESQRVVGGVEPFYDIQVGLAFIAQWKKWQCGGAKDAQRAANRLVEDIRGIFGFKRLEIMASDDAKTLLLNIDGEGFMLHEVGAGIAQFIMVLGNAAIKRPAYVLLDEPENSLHPSLQRCFLTAVASQASEGVLFATHSLGLAQSEATQIYSVRRISQGDSEVRFYGETPHLAEFLGELSYAAYKEVGYEKLLLVEGVTDVGAIRHFLSLYGKDSKFIVLPMGGGQYINGKRREELCEVQRICPKVSALIDSEKGGPGDLLDAPRQDFCSICASMTPPIPYKVLDRRAIENYFTDSAIKAILGPTYSALGTFDKAPKPWKGQNWQIASQMTLADIQRTDLGQFLESL